MPRAIGMTDRTNMVFINFSMYQSGGKYNNGNGYPVLCCVIINNMNLLNTKISKVIACTLLCLEILFLSILLLVMLLDDDAFIGFIVMDSLIILSLIMSIVAILRQDKKMLWIAVVSQSIQLLVVLLLYIPLTLVPFPSIFVIFFPLVVMIKILMEKSSVLK